jgi:hypothetical protein
MAINEEDGGDKADKSAAVEAPKMITEWNRTAWKDLVYTIVAVGTWEPPTKFHRHGRVIDWGPIKKSMNLQGYDFTLDDMK